MNMPEGAAKASLSRAGVAYQMAGSAGAEVNASRVLSCKVAP